MRAPLLVGIVAALHIGGITALVIIQGCGTPSPDTPRFSRIDAEPPPPPAMPPVVRAPSEPPAFDTAPPPPAIPTPTPPPTEGSLHVVGKGETLSGIAQRYGVRSRDLAEYNNLADPNRIQVGQKIVIPPYAERQGQPMASTAPSRGPSAGPAVAGSETYIVQGGDTLSGIAKRNNTSVKALKEVNNLSGDLIRVGQTLKLPHAAGAAGSMAGPAAPRAPEPSGGETPSGFAATGGDPARTRIEDIPVPDDGSTPTRAIPETDMLEQDKPITYTVMEGDTIEDLAKLFIVSKDDIMQMNDLEPGQTLRPGQTIKIPQGSL